MNRLILLFKMRGEGCGVLDEGCWVLDDGCRVSF